MFIDIEIPNSEFRQVADNLFTTNLKSICQVADININSGE